jgi:hypothetical protein
MKEKALAASDTTLDSTSRSALSEDFKALRDQMDEKWLVSHSGLPLVEMRLVMTKPTKDETMSGVMPAMGFEPAIQRKAAGDGKTVDRSDARLVEAAQRQHNCLHALAHLAAMAHRRIRHPGGMVRVRSADIAAGAKGARAGAGQDQHLLCIIIAKRRNGGAQLLRHREAIGIHRRRAIEGDPRNPRCRAIDKQGIEGCIDKARLGHG